MSRDTLHDLVDRIPDEEVPAARRYLEYLLVSPAYRSALLAPLDDEPVTESDAKSMAQVREQIRNGRVVPHAEVLREFDLR
jgi:hypothetical protein